MCIGLGTAAALIQGDADASKGMRTWSFVTLGRIGINDDGNQALIHVTVEEDLWIDSSCYLLERHPGGWQVRAKMIQWAYSVLPLLLAWP